MRHAVFNYRVALLAVLALAMPAAQGQTRLTRTVQLIVPYVPGGATDALARLMAPALAQALGQSVAVENRPGGGSSIGTHAIAKAVPDGHVLGMIDSAFITNPSLIAKLPYDTLTDFAPIVFVATAPLMMVVHPSVPANNLAELIAFVRAKPGVTYASGGIGSGMHLAAEQLRIAARIDLVHVPYKGLGQAITDVLAGQAQIMFASPGGLRGHVAAGKLRAIAVTGAARAEMLPEVPRFAENGLPEVDAISLQGLVAPTGTPADYIERVNAAVNAALKAPEVRTRLAEMGFRAAGGAPGEFAKYIQTEVPKWTAVIKAAGIRPE